MSNEPVYVVGYARISTETQTKGDGLDNQVDAIKLHCEKNGWTLFPKNVVYKDVFSGRKIHISKRPCYLELRDLILENPAKIKYFVVARIDRSLRSGSEDYLYLKNDLASLGVELRDAQNIIQPTVNSLEHRGVEYLFSRRSPSRITEILTAEVAKDEVANILSRTMDTSISRIESGYKLREAQFGYRNKPIVGNDGKERFIQIRDEVEGIFIEIICEKTTEGIMTEDEIVDYVNSLGYKSRTRKKWQGKRSDKRIVGIKEGIKLDVKQMQKYRKNPIYCGVNSENWGETKKRTIITKTQYSGLVTIETFNLANKGKVYIEELPENKVKIFYNLDSDKIIKRRLKFRKEYLFKNILLCDLCKKPLLASTPKGKSGDGFVFYHCQREPHKDKYVGIPKREIDKTMMTFLSKLSFAPKYHSILERILVHKYEEEQSSSLEAQSIMNKQIAETQIKLKNTLDAFKMTTSQGMRVQLQNEYEETEEDLAKIKIERKKLELDYEDLVAFIKESKKFIEHPIEMFLNINTYNEQMAVYKILFEEFPTYSEILNGTPKTSLLFKVGTENSDEESLAVTLQRVELCLPA